MRNKFMKRGFVLLLCGILLNVLGQLIKMYEWDISGYKLKYGWIMIFGVVLFGVGFLYVLYSLMRKVERHSILEERAIEKENAANLPNDSKK